MQSQIDNLVGQPVPGAKNFRDKWNAEMRNARLIARGARSRPEH